MVGRGTASGLWSGSTEMDAYEATRIVFSRIQRLEPENVSKIMGYLLLQDHGEQEMIRLAFSPESLIQSLIVKAKKDLGLVQPQQQQQQQQQGSPTVQSYLSRISRHNLSIQPVQINSSRVFSSPTALSPHAPPWGSHLSPQARPLSNSFHVVPNELQYTNTSTSSVSVSSSATNNGYLNNFSLPLDQGNKLPLIYNMESPHPGLADSEFQLQPDQISFLNDSSSSESPSSHGNYLTYPEILAYNQVLNMDHIISPTGNNGVMSKRASSIADICNFSPDAAGGSTSAWKPCMYFARGYCKNGPNCRFLHSGGVRGESDYTEEVMGSNNGSLEKLELELQELLRGRRSPISIASLPQLYGERFGKSLQAESQRYRSEREHDRCLAPANPGSRQIYLTFPAESTFKEEDVSNYFSIFGPVQDVRIPYQQKRMFGFVTFVYQETVKIILAKGNPHYVCDARVLVKPYREKGSKPSERKFPGYLSTQNLDMRDYNLPLGPPRLIESNTEAMRRQLEEQELEQAIEYQARRFAQLQLVDRQATQVSITPKNNPTGSHENQPSNDPVHSEEDATASEDISSSTLADHFAYLLQVLDGEPNYEERPKQVDRHQDRCPIPNGVIRM